MANRRKDRLCVEHRICLSNEADDLIVRYQAMNRMKGRILKKPEASEQFIEAIIAAYGESMLK